MAKSMSKYLITVAVIATIGFLFLNPTNSLSQKSVVLFSEDDANKLRYSDSEWAKENIAKQDETLIARPSIVIAAPKVIDTNKGPTIIMNSPANVLVRFKQNDSTLDLDSLDVWAEKFHLKKNVTSLLKKYIKTNSEGAELHVESVHVPSGKYKIGFKIADINGQETTGKYLLKVE